MRLKGRRNLWVIVGLILIVFVRVTVVIPAINVILALMCWIRAYALQQRIKQGESIRN